MTYYYDWPKMDIKFSKNQKGKKKKKKHLQNLPKPKFIQCPSKLLVVLSLLKQEREMANKCWTHFLYKYRALRIYNNVYRQLQMYTYYMYSLCRNTHGTQYTYKLCLSIVDSGGLTFLNYFRCNSSLSSYFSFFDRLYFVCFWCVHKIQSIFIQIYL